MFDITINPFARGTREVSQEHHYHYLIHFIALPSMSTTMNKSAYWTKLLLVLLAKCSNDKNFPGLGEGTVVMMLVKFILLLHKARHALLHKFIKIECFFILFSKILCFLFNTKIVVFEISRLFRIFDHRTETFWISNVGYLNPETRKFCLSKQAIFVNLAT